MLRGTKLIIMETSNLASYLPPQCYEPNDKIRPVESAHDHRCFAGCPWDAHVAIAIGYVRAT